MLADTTLALAILASPSTDTSRNANEEVNNLCGAFGTFLGTHGYAICHGDIPFLSRKPLLQDITSESGIVLIYKSLKKLPIEMAQPVMTQIAELTGIKCPVDEGETPSHSVNVTSTPVS